ncbi:MAG: DnaA N-terminal domain-containing protein, partial [Kiritimatiellia bacterium]
MTNEELAGLWGRATARLREYVGQDVYAMWLASVVPVSNGRGLALEVENEFTKERFETVYLGLVRTALKECGAEESLLEHLSVEVRAGQSVDALPPMALTSDEPTFA